MRILLFENASFCPLCPALLHIKASSSHRPAVQNAGKSAPFHPLSLLTFCRSFFGRGAKRKSNVKCFLVFPFLCPRARRSSFWSVYVRVVAALLMLRLAQFAPRWSHTASAPPWKHCPRNSPFLPIIGGAGNVCLVSSPRGEFAPMHSLNPGNGF